MGRGGQRTCDPKAQFKILVVVCKMVLLHLLHVLRKLGVMKSLIEQSINLRAGNAQAHA
jgi:hypothetical protein